MLSKHIVALAAIAFISNAAGADAKATDDAHTHGHANAAADHSKQVRAILKNIVDDDDKFMRMLKQSGFEPFMEKQSPRATGVTRADSRAHSQALDVTPDGDLFLCAILAINWQRWRVRLSAAASI